MALKQIVPPNINPLTLDEAKAHLRIDTTDEDALVTLLIEAATAYADGPTGFLGRALINQTWDLVLDAFPTTPANLAITIPMPPLIEVVSVLYDDANGNEQTLDPASYRVDDASEPARLVTASAWPATVSAINAVRIRFRAGYVDTAESPNVGAVPDDIRIALLLYIGSLYANREQVVAGQSAVELPWGADQLLRRKRIDLSLA